MSLGLNIPNAYEQSIKAMDDLVFKPLIKTLIERIDTHSKEREFHCTVRNSESEVHKKDVERSPYLKQVLPEIEKTIKLSFNYDETSGILDSITADWDH